jgi:hypothetical protein
MLQALTAFTGTITLTISLALANAIAGTLAAALAITLFVAIAIPVWTILTVVLVLAIHIAASTVTLNLSDQPAGAIVHLTLSHSRHDFAMLILMLIHDTKPEFTQTVICIFILIHIHNSVGMYGRIVLGFTNTRQLNTAICYKLMAASSALNLGVLNRIKWLNFF